MPPLSLSLPLSLSPSLSLSDPPELRASTSFSSSLQSSPSSPAEALPLISSRQGSFRRRDSSLSLLSLLSAFLYHARPSRRAASAVSALQVPPRAAAAGALWRTEGGARLHLQQVGATLSRRHSPGRDGQVFRAQGRGGASCSVQAAAAGKGH